MHMDHVFLLRTNPIVAPSPPKGQVTCMFKLSEILSEYVHMYVFL